MRSLVFLEDQLARPSYARRARRRRPPPAAERTDAAFLEIACPPGDDAVPDLLGGARLRRRRPAPQQAGHLVAQRRRARRRQRGAGRAHARATALGVAAPPVERSPPARRRCCGPRSTPPAAPARRCCPGITSPSGCTSSSATPRAATTTGRATSSRPAGTGADASPASTTSSSRSRALPAQRGVAFFRTVFGLEPGPVEEFMEPHGRLRSSRLRPRQGDLRIVLNVTEASPHGAASGTASPRSRFACADVAAAVRAAAARGVPLMQVPDNYYVDLDARFGLAAEVARAPARAPPALRPGRRRASCCTRSPRRSPPASTSSCSSGAAGTTATAAPTRTSGWPPSSAALRSPQPEAGLSSRERRQGENPCMGLTARQLNRATLARQLLLRREPLERGRRRTAGAGPAGAVARLAVHRALESPRRLRPRRPRPGLRRSRRGQGHADADHPARRRGRRLPGPAHRHAADAAGRPAPRPSLQGDGAVAPTTPTRLIPDLLDFASRPRGKAETEAWLGERLDASSAPGVWWALRPVRAAAPRPDRRPVVVRHPDVVRRRGDATARRRTTGTRRCRCWCGATSRRSAPLPSLTSPSSPCPTSRRCARHCADSPTRSRSWRGRTAPSCRRPRRRASGRGHSGPAEAAGHVGQRPARPPRPEPGHPAGLPDPGGTRNGDVLPTVLVDGYVAGVWRPVEDGIEVTAFHRLPTTTGPVSPTRPGRWWRSWLTGIPAVYAPLRRTGGTSSRRVRCGCCPTSSRQTLEVRGGVTSNHPAERRISPL